MNKRKTHPKYYNAAGEVVPNATSIIGSNLGWKYPALMGWQRKLLLRGEDPNKARDSAADAGTLSHMKVENEIKEVLDPELVTDIPWDEYSQEHIDQAETAYLSYLEWQSRHTIKYLFSELRLVSEIYQFGGTLDIGAVVDDVPAIWDIKTSTRIYLDHRIQLASYRKLYYEVEHLWLEPNILHLDKETGAFAHHGPAMLGDMEALWRVFKHCRDLHHLRPMVE